MMDECLPPERQGPDLSDEGRRLLQSAEDVAHDRIGPFEADGHPSLSNFVQTYREWITTRRGRPGTQQEQAERWQLVFHAMITASNIGEAVNLLIRFGKVVWGERGPRELRFEGDRAILSFSEPFRPGPEGLIASIWPLALTLCELEFLANRIFHDAAGHVMHAPLLPESVLRLLLPAPLHFEQAEMALVIPKAALRWPVLARPADLPDFFRKLLPLTLGARREPPSIRTLVSGLIRDDKLGPEPRETSLANVAARLGMSISTLGRRLNEEGASFRGLKEEVYNKLAKDWLSRDGLPVEWIAERLGFSESFAFRRFFRRLNGVSPSSFRNRAADEAID